MCDCEEKTSRYQRFNRPLGTEKPAPRSHLTAVWKQLHGEGKVPRETVPREGGQKRGRKQQVISLQDVSALRNRTMVGTETLLGSSPLRQRGRGTLHRGAKRLGRGRNAENQRGKGGMKICMYKSIKKIIKSTSISCFC